MRAYTNYQRNFPPESYFTVCLTIINPNIPFPAGVSLEEEDVALIPEGGKLISGIPSRIAAKVKSSLADEAELIQIIDQQKRIITQADIFPNGTGIFSLTPADTLDYSVRIILKQGDTLVNSFPGIEDEGFSTFVNRTPTGLSYKVLGNLTSSQAMLYQKVTLSIKSAELITLGEYSVNLQNMPVSLDIPDDILHNGILYFILKSNDNTILQILPVYYSMSTHGMIHIQTDKSSYNQRELVHIGLISKVNLEIPLQVSISVIKHGTSQLEKEYLPDYVISNPFLLSSYLCFHDVSSPIAEDQADICMILYMPRINTVYFKNYLAGYGDFKIISLPEIRDVSLSGMVINKNSHMPLQDIPLFLSALDANQMHMYKSNDQGQFIFSLNNLTGIQNLFICPQPGYTDLAEILINQDFSNQFPELISTSSMPDSSVKMLLDDLWINAQIENLYGIQISNDIKVNNLKPLIFDEQRYVRVLSDYIEMASLNEVFWEIIPSVQIRKKKDHYVLSTFNEKDEVMKESYIISMIY
jgi:uncharacterized protein YifE (UPF0438 family)